MFSFAFFPPSQMCVPYSWCQKKKIIRLFSFIIFTNAVPCTFSFCWWLILNAFLIPSKAKEEINQNESQNLKQDATQDYSQISISQLWVMLCSCLVTSRDGPVFNVANFNIEFDPSEFFFSELITSMEWSHSYFVYR